MCIFLNRDSVLQTENLRPIRSSGSTEGALEEAGRAEQHIITDAAPNELKPDEGAYSDERGPSARW